MPSASGYLINSLKNTDFNLAEGKSNIKKIWGNIPNDKTLLLNVSNQRAHQSSS